jgi:hypothetical protein
VFPQLHYLGSIVRFTLNFKNDKSEKNKQKNLALNALNNVPKHSGRVYLDKGHPPESIAKM